MEPTEIVPDHASVLLMLAEVRDACDQGDAAAAARSEAIAKLRPKGNLAAVARLMCEPGRIARAAARGSRHRHITDAVPLHEDEGTSPGPFATASSARGTPSRQEAVLHREHSCGGARRGA